MSTVGHLAASLVELASTIQSERSLVLAARDYLRRVLPSPVFRNDVLDLALDELESSGHQWTNPPIYVSPHNHLRVQLTYWPPGLANLPHVHTHWTITGVLHNEITVDLTDGTTSSAQSLRTLTAHRNDVGYLLPPCAHRLRNHTTHYSVLLHVFTGSDGESANQGSPANFARSPIRALNGLMQIASVNTDKKSLETIGRIFYLGNNDIKLACVKALVRRDVVAGIAKLDELLPLVTEGDRHTLSAFLDILRNRTLVESNASGRRVYP